MLTSTWSRWTIWVDRLVHELTKAIALASGLVMLLAAILTVLSVVGRRLIPLGLGPIPGDFELVEICTSVAVFGFLPYCHLSRGHVTVDVLVNAFPTWAFNALTLIGDVLIALISGVVAWRLWFGVQEKLTYGESTMILGAPLWYSYSLAFGVAFWGTLVAIYVIGRDLQLMRAGGRMA